MSVLVVEMLKNMSHFNTSVEFEMVKWLDKNFFETALRAGYADDSIEIAQFSLRAGTRGGDNYASSIYRCIISYKCKKRLVPHAELIVKTISSKINSLADEISYDIEVDMYQNVIPKMEESLKEIGEAWNIAPKLLYCHKKPVPVIVYEDLYEKGYRMPKQRLNLDDTLFVTKKLAMWHALSYYLNDKKKLSFERFNRGLFNLQENSGLKFIRETLRIFIDVINDWDDCKQYIPQLKNIYDKFLEHGEAIYTHKPEGFNVLVHGDFHNNNFMVKVNSMEKMTEVLFMDFQMSIFASPTIDLCYLLYLVASNKAREKRDDILKQYHDEFQSVLKKFTCKNNTLTLLELNNDMQKNGFLEVVMAICFVPFFYIDQIGTTFDNIVSQDDLEFRKKLFNLDDFKAFIVPQLNEFLNKGLLDI